MPPPHSNKKPRSEASRSEQTGGDEGSLTSPLKFLNQDYQELLQDCLKNEVRYTDEKFPPDSSSIDPQSKLKLDLTQVKWIRPSKLVSDPELTVEGVSRFDYAQGNYLGNCWFLASVGALTFQKDIVNQVIPAGQSFSEDYAGIFHFRFWRFGRWIDVVIDDKLPTIDDKLIFVHSKTSNEFWPALLEKAYAKVCGSYYDMHAGHVSEALMDFTGGVHMSFELKTASADVWSLMHRAAKAKALIGCGTPQGATSENTVLPNGIVQGHAYTVTGVFKVQCQSKSVDLVRVLNPWGRGEWTGAWSDRSSVWRKVSERDRSKCQSLVNDGEFWMSKEDFTKSFDDIDICCLNPEFLDGSSECTWSSVFHHGRWDAASAGGCMNHKETFWTNPQFRVRIEELDEDRARGQRAENILVSLMQNHEKRHRRLVSNYYIGFNVFAIPPEMIDDSGKIRSKFFRSRKPVTDSGNYVNGREVMKFFKLDAGEYLIVPSTFKPNECASFTLSIYSKTESHKTDKKPLMTYV